MDFWLQVDDLNGRLTQQGSAAISAAQEDLQVGL